MNAPEYLLWGRAGDGIWISQPQWVRLNMYLGVERATGFGPANISLEG